LRSGQDVDTKLERPLTRQAEHVAAQRAGAADETPDLTEVPPQRGSVMERVYAARV
jgi:hypothetical protein